MEQQQKKIVIIGAGPTGLGAAYRLKEMPKPKVLAELGEPFRPYRSIAAWYMWQAIHLARAGELP